MKYAALQIRLQTRMGTAGCLHTHPVWEVTIAYFKTKRRR